MIVRRILFHVKTTAPYVCCAQNYNWKLSRNIFEWKRTLNQIYIMNLLRITNTQFTRYYAKNMNKAKSKGPKKVELREDILSEYFNVDRIKMEMNEVVEYMKEQFFDNVSVRSSVGTIESISVEYEGAPHMIRDLAQVNRKNPKMIVLNFSAFPQTIPTVLETLKESGLNLNPQQDGTTVYVPVPKVTREHRENLAKSANAVFTKCKAGLKEVEVRFIRKLELRSMNEKISIEKMRILQEQLTVLAGQYLAEMEKIKTEKLKELLKEE